MQHPDLPPTEVPNPQWSDLDRLTALQIVQLMFREEAEAVWRLSEVAPQVAACAEAAFHSLSKGGRLIYVGAGTSGRLGILDAVECVPTFRCDPTEVCGVIAGGRKALWRSVEGAEDNGEAGTAAMEKLSVGPADTVCGIAACGHTPFVLAALREAARRGATTLLVSSTLPPEPPPLAVHVPLQAGPEVVAGSTRLKAGTSTKIILNAISTAAMVRLGKVYGNLMVDVRPANRKLRSRAVRLVTQLAEVSPEQAEGTLRKARWEVKTAVVMLRCGLTAAQARKRLEECDGYLRGALEP